jgi:hypothetical protein
VAQPIPNQAKKKYLWSAPPSGRFFPEKDPGFDPLTVNRLARSYTDYAIQFCSKTTAFMIDNFLSSLKI